MRIITRRKVLCSLVALVLILSAFLYGYSWYTARNTLERFSEPISLVRLGLASPYDGMPRNRDGQDGRDSAQNRSTQATNRAGQLPDDNSIDRETFDLVTRLAAEGAYDKYAQVFGFDVNNFVFNPEQVAQSGDRFVGMHGIKAGGRTTIICPSTDADRSNLVIDRHSGAVKAFFRTMTEYVPATLTRDDGIPKEESVKAAREMVERLALPSYEETGMYLDLDKPTVTGIDYIEASTVLNDLYGTHWVVKFTWKYADIPSTGDITFEISAYSGRVRRYALIPPRKPLTTEVNIEADDARRIAEDFMKQREYIYNEQEGPILLMMRSSNYWSRAEGKELILEQRPSPLWTMYFYNVLADDEEWGHSHSTPFACVQVDATTGEVASGSTRNYDPELE